MALALHHLIRAFDLPTLRASYADALAGTHLRFELAGLPAFFLFFKREMQHTPCWYERTSAPPRQLQLPRTRLSRRVDASSCWSTNKSTWPLAKCAGKTVDKSLPNACPHACFAAYAWPAADLARPCAPFRSTQCNVPAGTACRASRCVLKPTSQRLTFEHSKKRWKMVLIYSQHIWFFFVFFWGDVTVSSLFISRPGQTVVTNFIYKMQGDAIHDVIVIFVILL